MRKFTSSLIVLVLFCSIFFAFSLVSADSYNASSTDNTGSISSVIYSETNVLEMVRDTLYPFVDTVGTGYNYYFEDQYGCMPYNFWADGSTYASDSCYAGQWTITRGFFEFNTSGLPQDFEVSDASIKMNITENVGGGYYRIVKTNWEPTSLRDYSLEFGKIGEDAGYFGGKSFKTMTEVGILVDSNSTERLRTDSPYLETELFTIDENVHESIQAGTNVYVFRVDYKRKNYEGYADYGLKSGGTTYAEGFAFEDGVYTEYSMHWYGSYGDVVTEEFCGYIKDLNIYYEGYYDNTGPEYVACSDSFQITGTGWISVPLNQAGLAEIEQGFTYFSVITQSDYSGEFQTSTCSNYPDVYFHMSGDEYDPFTPPYMVINYMEGEPEPENSVPTKPVISSIGGQDANNSIVDDLTPAGIGVDSSDEDLETLYYCWLTIETGGDFNTPEFNTTFSEILNVASLGNLVNATTYDTMLVVTDLMDYNYSYIFTYTIQVLQVIDEEEEEDEVPSGGSPGGGSSTSTTEETTDANVTTTTATTNPKAKPSTLENMALVGGVIAGVAGISLILFLLWRKKKKKPRRLNARPKSPKTKRKSPSRRKPKPKRKL